MKILIVEDEAPLRETLGTFLRRRRHTVFEAEHGAAALARLAGEPVELVIADIRMPILDGIELLKAIKRDWPETEVVLVTGFQDLETAIAATRYDAYDYLTKPYRLEEIDHLVNRLAEQRELKLLLARIQQPNTRAQRLATLGVIAAGLIDEINRSNTQILGHAVLLKERLAPLLERPELRATIEGELRLDGAELVKSVTRIVSGADRVAALVHRGLTFRGLAGPAATADAAGCLATVLDAVQERLAGVTLIRPEPGPPLPVAASEEELRQVYDGLLANALGAVAGRPEAMIRVGLVSGDDRVTITVDDNRPGLAPDRIERLFDPAAADPTDGGDGLGLFIVHLIVGNLNGTIRFERRAGNITRFHVELPRASG